MTVREVVSKAEPEGWSTRLMVLEIKKRFSNPNLIIQWNRRTANQLAHAVVKGTFARNIPVYFHVDLLAFPLPTLFYEIGFQDLMGGSL